VDLWPHQQRGIDNVQSAIAHGERRICLTSPTGGGKTEVICRLIETWGDQGLRTAVYTNRKMLVEQLHRVLDRRGIAHGVRASEWESDPDRPVQVCSLQTEHVRMKKSAKLAGIWNLHKADRVVIDEAHLQTGPVAQKILDQHYGEGAAYLGVTATPVGLSGIYDCLLVAGIPSELRACGSLVPCRHFGPDEPDLRQLKRLRLGEDLSENQQRKAMGPKPQLWGRVWEWFEKLNPEHKPTILFAPGVPESVWFAQQFTNAGVPAAHLDGEEVWVDGQFYQTSKTAREDVVQRSKDGSIRVICNRYVLREGIDLPWLCHGIFATVFGSLQSYLQSGGRLLRGSAGLEHVVLQDHGGNWWRHGSLNADREWNLDWDCPRIAAQREDRMRAKKDKEPWRCRECAAINQGRRCTQCGHEPVGKKSRPVMTTEGSLKEMVGDIFRPRRISQRLDGPKVWEKMYWRSRTQKGEKTFRQAMALFAAENNWCWPDPKWPLMPKYEDHSYRLVKDVAMTDLNPRP
jgi:superfamily II DNA or RNA helicase